MSSALSAARPALVSLSVSLLMLAVVSCAGFAAKGEAETAVVTFHHMLDAERYADIYDATDDIFKGATTSATFTEILRAVHKKLGDVRTSTQTEFYSRDQAGTNAGSYISLTYDTEFAEGHATESFNWRVAGGEVRLAGYNIKSPLLITR